MSFPERTIRDLLSRIDKDAKVAPDKKIFDLWMAGYTQEEIGGMVGCVKATVNEVLNETFLIIKF